ncbi:DUF6443 domain-containing protein [Sphingobacterium oryzagri]|uniref:DUF6443 domain-containing protein n=1 Tax=Sphingobacterium oryzagri TaxID=3025669 RepID=A0ABY7WP10_9SPHI|nr:DUF6443 domain-containing protein [Sphingobacterium sp. KACC 22765]WDF70452.1 DUF6443 domain-containing protein [Sphingobacterium sp. KACC 22765]
MKQILYILLFLAPVLSISQSNNQNYVKNVVYKQPRSTAIHTPTSAQASISVTYLDGLGRTMQEVAHRQSLTGTDIVTPVMYDEFGRQTRSYLPYVTTSDNMAYDAQAETNAHNFYNVPAYENTPNPYSEMRMETSSLGRILEQGAPGVDWEILPSSTAGHTVKFEYASNAANQVRMIKANATWNASSQIYNPAITSSGYYPADSLYRTIIKDENWTSGQLNTTEEFKDKQGKTVLKRAYSNINNVTTAHDTYYVYDQFGNLSYVLPPLANGSTTSTVLTGLCYQYKYDTRNRLVEKKLPGKSHWEFIVYDNLDRVVASGPTNSPFGTGTQGWRITRYDVYGRIALTGWTQATSFSTATRKTLQDTYNGAVTNATRGASTLIDNITTGYSNTSLPAGFKLLTVNYYDDYTFPNSPTSFSVEVDGEQLLFYNNTDQKPKGLSTGSWVRVLTSATSTAGETSYIFYNKQALPVRMHTINHLGGYTYTDTRFNFTGKPLSTLTRSKRLAANDELLTREDFTYTAQDQLSIHTHTITFQGVTRATELLSKNEYDALGQLKTKRVGGLAVPGKGMQKVDYAYNVRGWLKGINDTGSMTESGEPNDFFAFRIGYNDVEGMSTPLYNGNIAETYWRSAPENVLRKCSYDYDGLNRMTHAAYQKPGLAQSYTAAYDEEVSYDRNGNILTLQRIGYLDGNAGATYPIDDLVYQYNSSSNVLRTVDDKTFSSDGFYDGNKNKQYDASHFDNDYEYDSYGNFTVDWNKSIDKISYNHMNLPILINFKVSSGQKFISYIYNALGQKVGKRVLNNSPIGAQEDTVTDYLGGYQYVDNKLELFPTAEGYVRVTDIVLFNYVYNYRDHLGNIRLSYTRDHNNVTRTLEENHYYPFGMRHSYNKEIRDWGGSIQSGGIYAIVREVRRGPYQYKFNGQEFQDELELNITAMDFRQYDNTIGRFSSIDALSEFFFDTTPYNFTLNNPVVFSDPTGLCPECERNVKDPKNGSSYVSSGGGTYTYNDGEWTQQDDELDEVMVGGASKSSETAAEVADIVTDFIPIVGSTKDIYNGFKEGDGWQVAMGVGFLIFDVGTLGTGTIIKGALKQGAKAVVREVAEREAKQLLITAGKKTLHKHHIMPQQFRKWFSERGISNIDDFTVQLSSKHILVRCMLLENGIKNGPNL